MGQHFLKDENICRKIISVLQEQSFSRLLEVGPGAGALTKYLIEIKGIDFKAVEIDQEKAAYLLKTYPQLKNNIIQKDFLEMKKPFDEPFTVVGNFPYNISSQILFKILEWKESVECVVGMFQKEVAQRVASKEGNKTYGVTSVLIQAFFKVEYLFEVNEKCFQPPPKVKSAVIRFLPNLNNYRMRSEKHFFILVKTAFNQRRKMLRNSIRDLFDPDFLSGKIFDKRPEQLTIGQFAELTFKMK